MYGPLDLILSPLELGLAFPVPQPRFLVRRSRQHHQGFCGPLAILSGKENLQALVSKARAILLNSNGGGEKEIGGCSSDRGQDIKGKGRVYNGGYGVAICGG